MGRVRIESFTLSIDGFGAGPDQSLENPLGIGGSALHGWAIPTRTFQTHLFGNEDGRTGPDDDFARRGFYNVGAWILGRNMFGPVRGPWPDDSWKGWWGDDPVYHTPVFVLTHYPRPPVVMKGGTTFHFITDGIHAALESARAAAGGKDVRIGGGVSTVRQYLLAGLVDEMHLVISPVILGSGERLFDGITLHHLGYRYAEHVTTENAMHVVVRRAVT